LTASEPEELRVPADLAETGRVRAFLRERLHGLAVTDETELKLELSLHEIFVNIAMYAYPSGKGEVAVRVWNEDGAFYMEFRDRGVPFDPGQRAAPDLEAKIRQGAPGGYGIFLFKTLMDGYSYERRGNENVLRIYKKL
jgi:serine/threonine-protein kinase RsbW